MDDVTVQIDELVLGASSLDEITVAAAIREQAGESVDARVVYECSHAIV